MKPRVLAALALTVTLVLAWASTAIAWDWDRSSDAPEAGSTATRKTYLPVVFNEYAGCPAVVALLSPANGESLHGLAPLFRWNPGSDPRVTSARLETATDPGFASMLHYSQSGDERRESYRFALNFPEATTVYWRVVLICGEEEGSGTPVWSFSTGSGGTIPPAPSLLAPANGSTLSTSVVTLRWSPVSGAVDYFVRWRRNGAHYYVYRWVADTQMTESFWSDNTYEWWVAARSSYAIGADSAVWSFTTPAAAE